MYAEDHFNTNVYHSHHHQVIVITLQRLTVQLVKDLKFSHWWRLKSSSSGLWQCVVLQ